MRWSWSSNGRARNGQHKNGNGFEADGAQPDFLCVGAQKGGTSWLFHQLTLHPDFWMPPVKEVHYFDSMSRVERKNPPRCKDERDQWFMARLAELSALPYIDLDTYSELFAAKKKLLSGDITPAYSMLNDELIEKIAGYFPNLNVIFLARDPVDRAWSQLSMGVRLGNIPAFDSTNPAEVLRNLLSPGVFFRSYPSKSVKRWRRYVHPDLFRIYFFDDLKENPVEMRRSILSFLGADPGKQSGSLKADYNGQGGKEKLPLTDKVRACVAQFFEHELKACAVELGGRAKSWPERYGFSLLLYFWDLLDDSIDLFFWCDWIG